MAFFVILFLNDDDDDVETLGNIYNRIANGSKWISKQDPASPEFVWGEMIYISLINYL